MKNQTFGRRTFIRTLATGTAALYFPYRTFAQQAPASIQTMKLSDTITMLSGDGGNIGVAVADDGVLMVDAGLAPRANDLIKAVADLSPRKVAILFNTHFHFDHVGANELLGKGGTKIMAHENVKKVLAMPFKDDAFARTFDPLKPEG